MQTINILFVCVENAAHSQIAEGLAKKLFTEDFAIESAGMVPGKVDPLAIQVLEEIGIDTANHFAKAFEDLRPSFASRIRFLINVCDEEVRPRITSDVEEIHWPFEKPTTLEQFRVTRQLLLEQLKNFAKEHRIDTNPL